MFVIAGEDRYLAQIRACKCVRGTRRHVDPWRYSSFSREIPAYPSCSQAQLGMEIPFILHRDNTDDLKALHDLVCSHPAWGVAQGTLHTFSELRSIIARLGNEDERMDELKRECERLRRQKGQTESEV